MKSQQIKAKELYNLHHSGKMLVLPNIWDSLGIHPKKRTGCIKI